MGSDQESCEAEATILFADRLDCWDHHSYKYKGSTLQDFVIHSGCHKNIRAQGPDF